MQSAITYWWVPKIVLSQYRPPIISQSEKTLQSLEIDLYTERMKKMNPGFYGQLKPTHSIFRQSIFFAILLSAMLVSGCSPYSNSPLCGEWEIASADSLLRKLGQRTEKEEEIDSSQPPKMVLKFRANGKLTTMTRMGRLDPPAKEGTWEELSFVSEKNLMVIKCKLGNQITEHEVQFLETDLIELVPPNMAGTNNKVKFIRSR
jgi:hypothetical protein